MAGGGVDLVLLDVMMPRMDGFAVLERHHADPAIRDVPVIMISALDDTASVVRCIEAGAEDYLPKPFDPVLLKARVSACIEKKRLRDAEKALLATVQEQAAELRQWNEQLERRVADQVREVERLNVMQRFIPPQLAEIIASGGIDLLTSHRREITVLFCDLRGFTPFSEKSEPEDVMAVLAELHNAVGPLIFEHGGTLAYITGDGMMVFFNDPIPCDDPARRAVRLALGMRDRAAQLSKGWLRRGHELQMGVGVAAGYATCGQVGFEGRYEYTAIGNVTNLAARLCGEAKGGEVLVSERVLAMLDGAVKADHLGDIDFKGIARPVPTYVVRHFTD
jgi:class 3 adenylate cyclase